MVRTFLFTDLEGSTKQWLEDEVRMDAALARHDEIVRAAVSDEGGTVLKHTGDGVLAVFDEPLPAVLAAVAVQRHLRADPEGEQMLRARMAVHSGPCTARDGDYFGPTLNRAARIMAAGHGGQVLVSAAVASDVGHDVQLHDLGTHRLRDLLEPEVLHQVVVDDAGAYPPLRSLEGFEHNLPTQRTALIGRKEDVEHVRSLLADASLVTLAGIGGVGKTRLALEVAAHQLDHRSVAFVDLVPVSGLDGVLRALAGALGLPPGEAANDVDTLVQALGHREGLLLLDNCEHVLDESAELVEAVLAGAPGTSILTTSREPLGVDGERVWRVPSLVDRSAAVQLFTERATAVRPEFVLDEATEPIVAGICEHLDGIPLAIELAAARTSHLSVTDIADRLQERFRLLSGGRRRARQRHQTLQAALDWSHDLLSAQERLVLRRSAVFTGTFSLAALATVVDDLDGHETLDLLGSLVERSLVVPAAEDSGASRFRLLETVRLYALDRLAEAAEAEATRDRHLEWVRTWIGEPPPGSGMRFQASTTQALLERDNVLAALDWIVDDPASIGRLVPLVLDRLTAYVWVDDTWSLFGRSDVEAVLDREELARYLTGGSVNANALGDFPRQAELASRAREVARHGSSVWRAATTMLANAEAVFRPDVGHGLFEEVLAVVPEDEPEERASVLGRSSDPALMTGDLEEGVRRLDSAEEALRRLNSAEWATTAHRLEAGFPHLLLGNTQRVREVLAAADDLSGWNTGRHRLLAGVLEAVEGRFDEAARHLVHAARAVERAPMRLVDRDVLTGFGALSYHEGDHRRAAELIATAENGPIWARTPSTYALHVAYRRLVREHISRDEVAAIRARAASVSVEDALAAEVARRSDADDVTSVGRPGTSGRSDRRPAPGTSGFHT
jgi:predicted ATPase/class 3 adenylate cyclase